MYPLMFESILNKDVKEAWGDDRRMTVVNRGILSKKTILRKLIASYYLEITDHIAPVGRTLELGSGGGFLKDYIADAITSDMVDVPGVDIVCDGTNLPFKDSSLGNIVLRGVLHHIHEPMDFFAECERVLMKGGRIIINDPYITPFSWLINKYIHFEHCDSKADWRFKKGQPLMDCNLALATIIFKKRLMEFQQKFPGFEITHRKHHTFFIYLLSGGYSYPALIPGWMFGTAMFFEKLLSPLNQLFANIIFVVVEKRDAKGSFAP